MELQKALISVMLVTCEFRYSRSGIQSEEFWGKAQQGWSQSLSGEFMMNPRSAEVMLEKGECIS
jgi:hypothetical protein